MFYFIILNNKYLLIPIFETNYRLDMEKEMLTFDITNDFIVGDRITKETLNKYSKLPHKIKAGLFLLCVEGSVQASINLAKYTINKYDFVTLVPSNFIQFHEISDDARFYFAGFSSEFMTNINFIKSTMSFLPVITEHPIMPLEESVAQLYIDGYRLLIRAQSLSPSYSMVNKNLVIAYLTIFMQGTAELYKIIAIGQMESVRAPMRFTVSLSNLS